MDYGFVNRKIILPSFSVALTVAANPLLNIFSSVVTVRIDRRHKELSAFCTIAINVKSWNTTDRA